MSQIGETFFTTVGCMDGRVQNPIAIFGQEKFSAIFPDTITEAGLVGLLAHENIDELLLASLKKKIMISFEKHHSQGIVVHGHQECAGNPVSDELQKEHIRKTVQVISALIEHKLPVVGVFVKRTSSGWGSEELI